MATLCQAFDKKEGATTVTDQVKGKQVNKVLTDYLPDFEI